MTTQPPPKRVESVSLTNDFTAHCTIIGDERKPLLLLLIGSSGIGAFYSHLATHLSSQFRCIYYDKRGFISRKTRDPEAQLKRPNQAVSVRQQADDAASLINHFSPNNPAFVFGTSTGATAVLDLTVRHPQLIHTAILHEPILFPLLESSVRHQMRELYKHMVQDPDPAGSMQVFTDYMYGLPDSGTWRPRPHVLDQRPPLPPPSVESYNGAQAQQEAQAMLDFVVDEAGTRRVADKLVVVCGVETKRQRVGMPGAALAAFLGGAGRRRWELAGGHITFAARRVAPAFAAQLLFVLHQERRIEVGPEVMAKM